MLRQKDRIRNDHIRDSPGVASIENKIRENCLRWFGHAYRRIKQVVTKRCDGVHITTQKKTKKKKRDHRKLGLTEENGLNHCAEWREEDSCSRPI